MVLATILPRGIDAPADATSHTLYPELVVRAADPAGAFTLTLHHGRLVAATLDDIPQPAHRLHQEGNHLRILDASGGALLVVRFDAPGTFHWDPRPPRL
jgi:hypothetical protein